VELEKEEEKQQQLPCFMPSHSQLCHDGCHDKDALDFPETDVTLEWRMTLEPQGIVAIG